MPGVEPVRKRNSSLREITVRRDSGRPPDTDERVEQMARLIAGPVPCWCPDDWREPFDKAACPLHGGQEWPAGFHRERVRRFLAADAPSPSLHGQDGGDGFGGRPPAVPHGSLGTSKSNPDEQEVDGA